METRSKDQREEKEAVPKAKERSRDLDKREPEKREGATRPHRDTGAILPSPRQRSRSPSPGPGPAPRRPSQFDKKIPDRGFGGVAGDYNPLPPPPPPPLSSSRVAGAPRGQGFDTGHKRTRDYEPEPRGSKHHRP